MITNARVSLFVLLVGGFTLGLVAASINRSPDSARAAEPFQPAAAPSVPKEEENPPTPEKALIDSAVRNLTTPSTIEVTGSSLTQGSTVLIELFKDGSSIPDDDVSVLIPATQDYDIEFLNTIEEQDYFIEATDGTDTWVAGVGGIVPVTEDDQTGSPRGGGYKSAVVDKASPPIEPQAYFRTVRVTREDNDRTTITIECRVPPVKRIAAKLYPFTRRSGFFVLGTALAPKSERSPVWSNRPNNRDDNADHVFQRKGAPIMSIEFTSDDGVLDRPYLLEMTIGRTQKTWLRIP